MKIYELYLTYSIIIISPAPDRDWDGALHVVPNLSQQARHQLEIGFWRSAFLETADQTPPSDYRPIMIGSRSIGAPLINNADLSASGIKSSVFLYSSPAIMIAVVANTTNAHAYHAAARESSKLGDFQAL